MLPARRLLTVARVLLLVLLNCPLPEAAAQTCTPIYRKTYDGSGEDEGLAITRTADGGYVVAGTTTSESTSTNGFLLKLNEGGDIQWVRSYGGSGYDEISKVKQTADGGYLAAGYTGSFGQAGGEAWLLRTDAGGAVVWSRLLGKSGAPSRVKDILQLRDGGFAVALNGSEGSPQGDGMVVRLDASGTPLWSKRFDGGGSDGVHTVIEDGGELVVTGYTTGTNQDAVLMKLSAADGSFLWAKKFWRSEVMLDELLTIARIPGGYAFGVASKVTPRAGGVLLSLFKMRDDGTIYYARRSSVTTRTGYGFDPPSLEITPDGGFIFAGNDTTTSRNAVMAKMGVAGLDEWAQASPDYYLTSSINGLANFDTRGYLATGAYRQMTYPHPNSKVQVLKTNLLGRYGTCTGQGNGFHNDTLHNFRVEPFTWTGMSDETITATLVAPETAPLDFTVATLCEKQDCPPPTAVTGAACYATFLYHYPGTFRSVPFDVQKVSDGYIMSGYTQRYGIVPYLAKVGFDGAVAWAKTPTNYIHATSLQSLRPTDDGNVLAFGPDGHTIYHGAYTNTAIMKMTPGGQVLWARYVEGSLFDLQPIGNGRYTGFLLYNLTTPPVSVARIIIDEAGNMTYRKRLNSPYEYIATYRKLIVEGNHFYAAGELFGTIVIDKLDSAGNRVWTHRFKPDDKLADVEGLYMSGDSIYTVLRVTTPVGWTYKQHIAVVRVGKDGGGPTGFTLSQPDLVPDGSIYHFWPQTKIIRVTRTADNNFVLADRIPNGADSVVALTKFSPAGQVLWSKKFPALDQHRVMAIRDDEGSLMVLGYKMVNDPDYMGNSAEPWLMRLTGDGEVTSATGANCKAEPITAAATPLTLTEVFSFAAPRPTFDWTNFYNVAYTPIVQDLPVGSVMSCGIPADCSLLKVSGEDSVCNWGDTVVYQTLRNPGCVVPATWRYDTAFAQLVKATDTTLALRFTRPGSTKVVALYQTGCGTITDSLAVEVLRPARSLELGPDTTICPGNTVVLRARKGYASYRWQDGSADSLFTATQPGLYHVEVSDACGRRFADSVVVHPQPAIPFDVGPDRSKCNSDTVRLSAPAGFLNYSWSPAYHLSSPSGQEVVVNPAADAVYYVRAEKTPGCFAYDTVRVSVHHSPPVRLGADQAFCSGASLALDAGAGFSTYQWSTGEATQAIVVKTAGAFSVQATTDKGCVSADTLVVSSVWPLPRVALDANAALCAGATRTLDAGQFAAYQWHDGSASPTFTVSDTGVYYVQVADNHGCVGSDTVRITTILPLPGDFLPADTSICSYGKLALKPLKNYTTYLWNDGSRAPGVTIEQPGKYWLEVTDSRHCVGRDTIEVRPLECMKGVYIPNAFTPGTRRDGRNDIFRAMAFGVVKKFELAVYNRWGEMVFRTVDAGGGWDGQFRGRAQDAGVFVWVCRYQLEGEGEKVERGTVTLIR